MSTAFGKKHLSNYIGQIGETLVKKFLKREGFTVMSYEAMRIFVPHINSKFKGIGTNGLVETEPPQSVNTVRDFLGSMKKNFKDMNDKLDKTYAGELHKYRRFDFVARKGNDYFIVEVKTNKARLTKKNEGELKIAKKYGFIPMVVKTKVTLIADFKDVTIKTL
jgi:hypothetical protein